MDDAICYAVHDRDVAVAFSGGLDSGIIAAMAKKYAKKVTLYTVGSYGSHDVMEAESVAEELCMKWVHIPLAEKDVLESLKEMILIAGTKDPVTLSFEIPLFFVCKNCIEKEILVGQGADELFAGYSKYAGLNGIDLKVKIAEDLRKLASCTLPHEGKVAVHFGKEIRYPFLDLMVIGTVSGLEPGTVSSAEDPAQRKMILRDISNMLGYPSISKKEKKAAQYGSGAMTMIKKICKEEGITYPVLIEMLSKEMEDG